MSALPIWQLLKVLCIYKLDAWGHFSHSKNKERKEERKIAKKITGIYIHART